MKLLGITIENYKSIEKAGFEITELDGSFTYTLIGVNESGKSNFLSAISLVDTNEKIRFPNDYFDPSKPVRISLNYVPSESDEKRLQKELIEKGFAKSFASRVVIQEVTVGTEFQPVTEAANTSFETISFRQKQFSDLTFENALPVKKNPSIEQEDYDIEKYFQSELPDYFYQQSHYIVFWKADSKHLISEPIDLNAFAKDPNAVSIPLANCFALAGVQDIASTIARLNGNASDINNLQEKLGDKVTDHIKQVWRDHPITIKFQIDGTKLSLLIEDNNVRYESKTVDQRSDGFRQFISFLLTISAESANKQLSRSLLLLDEPETHLHPQAQEYLMRELIKLTGDSNNNIVFYATHSNHMIDKRNLNRCYRVQKRKNKRTDLERIEGKATSYSEVNYEIFDISSSDYHNELYGFLEERAKSSLVGLPVSKTWNNVLSHREENVSLPTYIRHSIHHPENTTNPDYTEKELKESIEMMRMLREEFLVVEVDSSESMEV